MKLLILISITLTSFGFLALTQASESKPFIASGISGITENDPQKVAIHDMYIRAHRVRFTNNLGRAQRISRIITFDAGTFITVLAYFRCA